MNFLNINWISFEFDDCLELIGLILSFKLFLKMNKSYILILLELESICLKKKIR